MAALLTEAQRKAEADAAMRANKSVIEFQTLAKKDAKQALKVELEKLKQTAPPGETEKVNKNFKGFKDLFSRFLQEKGPSIVWDEIQPLPQDAVISYHKLEQHDTENVKALLDKLVVIKLNGGLGTSMGCKGPKSVIGVRSELSFLDLAVQQIEHLNKKYGSDVPLVLMNSFNTDEDTNKVLRKYDSCQVRISTFNQSKYPRINKDSLLPIAKTVNSEDLESWYPPGHGDIYDSFNNSGLLDAFISQGKEFVFISNIDNLGATVDNKILNFLVNPPNGTGSEFVMEVTDKTRADVKGGTLTYYEDKLRLLEIAQVPREHVDEFKSVSKFRVFNTNNIWIKLAAIKRNLENKTMDLEVIVNNKTLDNGLNVLQLETAVGAAIKNFEAHGINVPRSRFLPVKKTSDLLLVMSNLYTMKAGSLKMNPHRQFKTTPLVKLGTHFDQVQVFLKRFGSIPNLIELDHLTVSGDVTFGKGVVLKGTVIIIANHGDRIDIPPGALLENKIVSGNLRILDH